MKRMMITVAGIFVMFMTAGALLAHHALGGYDTTTAVRVRGTVVLFQRSNPHSRLVLDEKGKDGKTHRWVVDGPNALQLTRRNFPKDALKAGDIVEVCGYVTKPGAESQRTISIEPRDLQFKAPAEPSLSGQILDGEVLVMPDGQKQVWSDYGHHKCLGADYVDIHSRGTLP